MNGESNRDEVNIHDAVPVLLAEYTAAQNSAEHHERLGWQARSILWAGSFLLLGATFNVDADWWQVLPVSIIGATLPVLTLFWDCELGKIKKRKYRRCQEIEMILGMKQHLAMSECKRPMEESKVNSCLYKRWHSPKRICADIAVTFLVAAWITRLILSIPCFDLWPNPRSTVQIHVLNSQDVTAISSATLP